MSSFIKFEKNKYPQILNPMNWFAGGGMSCWGLRKNHIMLNEGGFPINFSAGWGAKDSSPRFAIVFIFGLRAGVFF